MGIEVFKLINRICKMFFIAFVISLLVLKGDPKAIWIVPFSLIIALAIIGSDEIIKIDESNKKIPIVRKSGEFIICASVHYNDGKTHPDPPCNITTGFVVAGRRHSDCILTIVNLLGDKNADNKLMGREAQGFLTSTNRHVSRAEAFKIAKENNQIFHKMHDDVQDGGILISEDLY